MEPDKELLLPWLSLAIAEGGSGQPIAALLDPTSSPETILAWTAAEALARGIPEGAAHRLSSPRLRAEAEEAYGAARRRGLRMLCPRSPDYPPGLRELPMRPAVLVAEGEPGVVGHERPTVTIVGTRTPTA